MKVLTVHVFVFAAIVFLGNCAKLPKTIDKDDKLLKSTTSTAKHNNPTQNKQVTKHAADIASSQEALHKKKLLVKTVKDSATKHLSPAKLVPSKTSDKHENTKKIVKKNNKYWSTKSVKSVVVKHEDTSKDTVSTKSSLASNPMLDGLYKERYEAMEKVATINSKIEALMNEKQATDEQDENAVSSVLHAGSLDSEAYNVQGGTMYPGPANAGDVAGMESTAIRDSESQQEVENPISKNAVDFPPTDPALLNMPQPMNDQQSAAEAQTAPVDMPQPMYDQQAAGYNPTEATEANNANLLAEMDDQTVLGDPKMFDSVCAVLKLTFEHSQGAIVLDDSPQVNNVELEDGAYISDEDTKSGLAVKLGESGYMAIPDNFNGKPTKATAISMWVKLKDTEGHNPLFQTTDDNDVIHYDLSINDGKASWVHRDDYGKELFNVTAKSNSNFTAGEWHHVVGAYSAKDKEANLWLDGQKIGSKKGVTGILSQTWNKLFLFEGKTTGFADNVNMFRCSLDKTKVIALYVAVASPKDAKKSHIARQT